MSEKQDDGDTFVVRFKYRVVIPPPPRSFILYDVDLCDLNKWPPTDPEGRE